MGAYRPAQLAGTSTVRSREIAVADRNHLRFFLRVPALVLACAAAAVVAAAGSAFARQAEPAASPRASIVLPPVLVAGKPATLAVLDTQGRPAAGTQVSLGGDVVVTTDATGRAALAAPDAQGVLIVKLVNGTAEASATVVAAPASDVPPRIDSSPRLLLLRDRFTIRGTGFRGAADENRVLLAGQPAAILAASPAAIVALPNPRTPLGDTQLRVEVAAGGVETGPVSVIALELTAGRAKGLPGQTGEIRVDALGTDRPVDFEVRALPANRIDLAKGNPARGRTSGGKTNTATLTFVFREPGEFSLEVRQLPPPLGLPDTEAARRELEEARRVAPADQAKHVEHVIELLDKHPQDVTQARDAVEKMLAKKPEGAFGLHLEAAWHILLNRQ